MLELNEQRCADDHKMIEFGFINFGTAGKISSPAVAALSGQASADLRR
jgi:hypothetical protein